MMIRSFCLVGALLYATASTPSLAGVKILGVSIAKKDVCPGADTSKCVQKSTDATGTYIGNGNRYITIGADGEPIYNEYMARLYTRSLNKGTGYCNNVADSNALKNYATAKNIPYLLTPQQNTVNFSVKSKKILAVSGGIDPVAIATNAGVPAASLADVVAAISAAYKSVSSREIHISGTYKFIEVNSAIISEMQADNASPELKACRDWLLSNDRELIVSLTGYKLDTATASSELNNSFSSKIAISLGGKVTAPQMAAIESGFSTEIAKKAKLTFSPTFQLLSVSHYSPE